MIWITYRDHKGHTFYRVTILNEPQIRYRFSLVLEHAQICIVNMMKLSFRKT